MFPISLGRSFQIGRHEVLHDTRARNTLTVMKANEVDIIIIPGRTLEEDHWQSRWESRLSTARRIADDNPSAYPGESQQQRIIREARTSEKPVVLVAHSFGVPAAIHAVPHLGNKVCGGFFVAPPDITDSNVNPGHPVASVPYPRQPLPFPGVVIASRNDPACTFEKAEALARDWHALFLDAGEAGCINAESGHGPWPEGLMVFSQFLARL